MSEDFRTFLQNQVLFYKNRPRAQKVLKNTKKYANIYLDEVFYIAKNLRSDING